MIRLSEHNEHISFPETVRSEIQSAGIRAAETGRVIVEKQEKPGRCKSVAGYLSKDICKYGCLK